MKKRKFYPVRDQTLRQNFTADGSYNGVFATRMPFTQMRVQTIPLTAKQRLRNKMTFRGVHRPVDWPCRMSQKKGYNFLPNKRNAKKKYPITYSTSLLMSTFKPFSRHSRLFGYKWV